MTKSKKTTLKNAIINKMKNELVPSKFEDNAASIFKFKKPILVTEGLRFVHKVSDSPTCSWKTKSPNKIVAIERIAGSIFNVRFAKEVAASGTGWNTFGSKNLPLSSMPLEIMQKIAESVETIRI